DWSSDVCSSDLVLRCFTSPGSPSMPMDSAWNDAALPAPGFPIRKSPDHSLVSGSPRLFAATHVLHRLSAPRHPPHALSSLVTLSSHTREARLVTPECKDGCPHHLGLLECIHICCDVLFPSYAIFKERLPQQGRTWWSWTESNRRPPACKAGALPIELQPRILVQAFH